VVPPAVPPEVEPILNALVSRYGHADGTLLFNTLAEGTHLRIPLLNAVFAGIQPHLAYLDLLKMKTATAGLLESGLIEGAEQVKGMPTPVLSRLVNVYIHSRLLLSDVFQTPDVPAKTLYEHDRVNPRALEALLAKELSKASAPTMGLAGGSASDLFLGLFCRTIGDIGEPRAIAAMLDLFETRMGTSTEEQAYFKLLCGLARYFSCSRGLPLDRSLSVVRIALFEKAMPSKDLVFILYDFFNDDRYQARQLTVLFSLVITCIRAFYPGRRHLIPVVLGLQKSFIRISRTEGSRYVKTIFQTFVDNPLLDLAPWVEEGARIIRKHGDASESAKAYFQRESDLSRRIWREIDSGIHVASVSARLQHFANAMAERPVQLRISGSSSEMEPSAAYYTDGESVFVPAYIKHRESRDDNYMVLLHSVVHECAHIEFGSFLSSMERYRDAARSMERLFPGQYERNKAALQRFAQKIRVKLVEAGFPAAIRLREERLSPLVRLLFHVRFPFVLRSLWNAVEDSRVNRLLYAKYRGFAKERAEVDAIDFEGVPEIATLDPLGRLLSALVQRVWFGKVKGEIGGQCLPYFDRMYRVMETFSGLETTDAYDSIITASEIFAILLDFLHTECPKLLSELLSVEELDFDYLGITTNPRNAALPLELEWYRQEMQAQGIETGDKSHFEDQLRARALENIRIGTGAALGQFQPPQLSRPFLYPEWDSERNCYIEDHCSLFQPQTLPKDEGTADNLSAQNPGFVTAVRRAFMAMKPQQVSETRGLDDGHEVDFDHYVDNLMDLSTGHQMDSNFYIFTEKRERSVASALVLDMSPSTRQQVQGMSIFQHQKYAAYVLAEALCSVGDRFGIYTYYDFGPPITLFFPIKELDERYSPRHIAALNRFQPATNGWSRFSVGLRHLIRKLRDTREKAKIIFFITDGLPSYYEGPSGRTEESMEYQVDGRNFQSSSPVRVLEVMLKPTRYVQAELRKVREEAALAGVHLFCITLDEASVPFMAETFGSSFIYLPDISHLANRLTQVFRTLTT
jgi:hypothetical protein